MSRPTASSHARDGGRTRHAVARVAEAISQQVRQQPTSNSSAASISRRRRSAPVLVKESPMSLAEAHLHPTRDMNDIAGVRIPDSKMARDLTQFIRDTEPDLLFHHSTRVYLFGALTGE